MNRTFFKGHRARWVAISWMSLGVLLGQALPACGNAVHQPPLPLGSGFHRPGAPVIGVIAPNAEQVMPLLKTLRSELQPEFALDIITLEPDLSAIDLSTRLVSQGAKAVVLVDNSAVQAYAPVAQASSAPLPSLIVMASFVEELQAVLPNSSAIAFEPPAVTTLSDVRNLLSRRIERAGVVYRRGFENFIRRERARASQEHIELVAVEVPAEPSVATLSRALRTLERAQLDAVWVTNDNALLSKRLLLSGWVPFARRTLLPVVVGVPALVQSSLPFGTYAAVPDAVGLGVQAADMIYALEKARWRQPSVRVQPPVTVKTYLNVDLARALGASDSSQRNVDVLVGGT